MDQTINEKYKGKILNFVQTECEISKNAVTKVRDNFYIVIENGVRVLKQIVPTKLVESVKRRCQEWGISHQVENVVEQGEEVASISEVASAEL